MKLRRSLLGERFGKLTAIELVVEKPYSKRAYKCICECGTICTRLEATLKAARKAGRISSCGCYQKQFLTSGNKDRCTKAGLHRKDAFVNECNVQMTFREGTITTNTSGHQGISWSNTANKWHAYIGYKNYRANLGFYEFIEDAIKARELAEQAIKENRFEEFYYELRCFKLEDRCTKQYKKGRKS